jgi:chromosomal replication initiation ATPase DnaA
MIKKEKEKIISVLSKLNDIVARCKYCIEEANIIIKEIKSEYSNIAFPIPHLKVISLVNDEYGVDFTTRSRKTEVIDARFTCAYLLKKFTPLTLKEMAEYIGVSHHTSAMHAIETASNLMVTDINFRAKCNKIEQKLWEHHTQLYGNNLQKV